MKQTAIKATVAAAMISASAGEARAEDYKRNPFTLAFAGAITKNKPGKVNIHPATYKLKGLDISANAYTPLRTTIRTGNSVPRLNDTEAYARDSRLVGGAATPSNPAPRGGRGA